MFEALKIHKKLKEFLQPKQPKHEIVDDNVDDIRADRFAFETIPVERCAIFRMGVKLTPDLQAWLKWCGRTPEHAEAIKVWNRVFYSTFFHEDEKFTEFLDSDAHLCGEFHSAYIGGKVISSDGSFSVTPEEKWRERSTGDYYALTPFRYIGEDHREHGWWLNVKCKAKTFHEYAREQVKNDAGPAIVWKQFDRPMAEIEGVHDGRRVKHCDTDDRFKWGYVAEPSSNGDGFAGESAYISMLPVQKFDDKSLLFTAYSIHKVGDKIGGKTERIIRFLHHDNRGEREEFVITIAERNGQYMSSVKQNGAFIEDMPEFTDLASLRQFSADKSEQLSKLLNEYVFGDDQKRLLKSIARLDAYKFDGWKLVDKGAEQTKESQAQKGDVLRVCAAATIKQPKRKNATINKRLSRAERD